MDLVLSLLAFKTCNLVRCLLLAQLDFQHSDTHMCPSIACKLPYRNYPGRGVQAVQRQHGVANPIPPLPAQHEAMLQEHGLMLKNVLPGDLPDSLLDAGLWLELGENILRRRPRCAAVTCHVVHVVLQRHLALPREDDVLPHPNAQKLHFKMKGDADGSS